MYKILGLEGNEEPIINQISILTPISNSCLQRIQKIAYCSLPPPPWLFQPQKQICCFYFESKVGKSYKNGKTYENILTRFIFGYLLQFQ